MIVVGFFAYNLWQAHQRAALFFAAARAVLDEGNKLRSAVDAGVGYDSYVEHLASFKFKKDSLPHVSPVNMPEGVRQFREHIDTAERKYDRAQQLWEEKFKYPLHYKEQLSEHPFAISTALSEAGMAVWEADLQLSNLGETDFLFSGFR